MPNPAFNSLFVAPQALAQTASIPAPPFDTGSDFNDALKLAGQPDDTSPDPSTDQFDDSGPSWFDLNSWTPSHSQLSLQQSTDQPSNYSADQTSSQNQSSSDASWQSLSNVDRGNSSPTKLSNQSQSDSAQSKLSNGRDRRAQDADEPSSQSTASSSNADQSPAPKPTDKNTPTASDGNPEAQNSDKNSSQSNETVSETTEAVTTTIVSTAAKTTAADNTGGDTKTVARSPDATKSPDTKAEQTANQAAQATANVQTPAENDPATAVIAKAAQAQISQIPSKAAIENKKSAVKAENELVAQSQESTDESSAQNNTAQPTDQPQLQSASAQQSAVDAIASKSAASAGKSKRPTSSSTNTSNTAQQPASITNSAAATAIADQTVATAVASVSSTTTDQQSNPTTTSSSSPVSAQANLPASLTANVSPAASNAVAANTPGRIDLSATQSNSAVPAPRSATAQIDTVRFVQRVANAFKSIDDQGGEMRLRLSPPELGSLKVEVSVRNGTMTARLETENNTTRSLLLDNLPALRERLAGQNIKIHTFDVDLKQDGTGNGSANPPPDFSGARQGSARSQNNPRLGASRNNDAGSAAPITNSALGPLGNGQINIVV